MILIISVFFECTYFLNIRISWLKKIILQKIGISDKIYKKLEWSNMKKYDFLIVLIVLAFVSIIYISFNITDKTNIVEIIINNEIIDEVNIYEDNIYLIESDTEFIYIYKNNNLFKKIDNKYKKNIHNIITINNKVTKMTQSNCKGKDCMYMEINDIINLPIICTNGIVVKVSNNTNKSDIII